MDEDNWEEAFVAASLNAIELILSSALVHRHLRPRLADRGVFHLALQAIDVLNELRERPRPQRRREH